MSLANVSRAEETMSASGSDKVNTPLAKALKGKGRWRGEDGQEDRQYL